MQDELHQWIARARRFHAPQRPTLESCIFPFRALFDRALRLEAAAAAPVVVTRSTVGELPPLPPLNTPLRPPRQAAPVSAAASEPSAAPVSSAAPGAPAAPDDDEGFGKHAPARLVKRLNKLRRERELTGVEQAALKVAKVEWNKERAERRQRKKG